MPRYRYALTVFALLALSVAMPPAMAAAQDATPDPAQQAADGARLAACATPTAPGAPLTITGKGQTQSLPFALEGGAYTVVWSTADPTTIASFIRLESATDSSALAMQTILNANGKDGSSGQTAIYKVKPGAYFLSVRAPSGWSVTLTPIAI